MFFKKFDKNKPVMDLGANKGQTAIIFWFRGVETFCIEPHPIIFKDLQDIFSDIKYIHTINAAVVSEFLNEKEYIDLYIHKSQLSSKKDLSKASSLMIDKENVNKGNSVKVPAIQYKDLIKKRLKFSILKCDIEGYEYFLYKDILKYSNKFDFIILETHEKKNPQWLEKHQQLKLEFSKNLDASKFNLDWH